MRQIIFFLFSVLTTSVLFGQDTLPKFSVKNIGNDKIIISWANNFDSLLQISVQTSHDSLKNYRTIISLADPNARMNGFADTKALNDHMFYRLFVVKKYGDYFFTAAKRPVLDTVKPIIIKEPPVIKDPLVIKKPPPPVEVNKKPEWIPSFKVYANKDGYIFINLPDAEKQKYHLKFYEEDQSFLFEIKTVKEKGLLLDKTNFVHAGWFYFELYNDEKLVEKNKFYLPREF